MTTPNKPRANVRKSTKKRLSQATFQDDNLRSKAGSREIDGVQYDEFRTRDVRFDDQQYGGMEAALGQQLSPELKNFISKVSGEYLTHHASELDAPFKDEIVHLLRDMQKGASGLEQILDKTRYKNTGNFAFVRARLALSAP